MSLRLTSDDRDKRGRPYTHVVFPGSVVLWFSLHVVSGTLSPAVRLNSLFTGFELDWNKLVFAYLEGGPHLLENGVHDAVYLHTVPLSGLLMVGVKEFLEWEWPAVRCAFMSCSVKRGRRRAWQPFFVPRYLLYWVLLSSVTSAQCVWNMCFAPMYLNLDRSWNTVFCFCI